MFVSMTATTFEHLAGLLFNRPQLVHPDRLIVFVDAIADKTGIAFDAREAVEAAARIGMFSAGAQRAMLGPAKSKQQQSAKPYRMADGVAVIGIKGTLVNRGAWLGSYSGLQSYEGTKFQVRTALNDDDVKAVLLDVDSPGGQAAGAFETAALVRELRAKKRVTAVVDDMAASAAYAIASAASKVVITPTGTAGSIGVVMAHFDRSGQLDQAGIKPTLIHAGAKKVDGHPYAPLPDSVRVDLQAEVNAIYDMFVTTVATNRPNLTPDSIRSTEAAMYTGRKAIDAGLADEIGDIEKALADLANPALPPPDDSGLTGVKPAGFSLPNHASLAEILALPEAAGREDHAASLAKQGVSIDTARSALSFFPTKAERATRDAAEAARAAAANKAAAEAAERDRKAKIEKSWADVTADIGRRMMGKR